MADFTNNVPTQVQSPMQAQGGVENNSVATAIGGAGNVLSSIGEGLFGSRATAARKEIQKDHQNSFIGSFEAEQLKLADAYEQGVVGQDEARMRMRANYYKALSQYHGDPDDLARAHAAIVNTSGLGKIVETGTKDDQMKQALYTEVAKAGWIHPGMSDAEKDEAVTNYQKMQTQTQLLQLQSSQIGLQRAQIGLETDKIQQGTARISQQGAMVNLSKGRIELANAQEERQSRLALGQVQDTYNVKFQNDLNDIMRRKDAGKIDGKQAVMEISNALATVQGMANNLGQNAGGDYINNLIAPMKMRAEAATSYVNGDIDRKVLDNELFKTEALAKGNLLGDPEVARLSATSQLLKDAPYAFQVAVGNKMFDLLKKNSGTGKPADLLSDDPEDQKGTKNYLDGLKANMAMSLAGTSKNPQATDAELGQNVSQVLKGVTLYGNDADPKAFNTLTDFFATPEFGRYASKHPLPSDVTPKAEEVVRHQLKDVVVPLVQKELNATVDASATINSVDAEGRQVTTLAHTVRDLVEPKFVGTGMTFVPKDPNSTLAVKYAKKLNESASPVVNKVMRVESHFRGDMNYKTSFEDIRGLIYPEETPAITGE